MRQRKVRKRKKGNTTREKRKKSFQEKSGIARVEEGSTRERKHHKREENEGITRGITREKRHCKGKKALQGKEGNTREDWHCKVKKALQIVSLKAVAGTAEEGVMGAGKGERRSQEQEKAAQGTQDRSE